MGISTGGSQTTAQGVNSSVNPNATTATPSEDEAYHRIKKFQPDPIEAEGAAGIGTIAVILMTSLLGVIVILDFSTLWVHFQYGYKNVKWFIRKVKARRARQRRGAHTFGSNSRVGDMSELKDMDAVSRTDSKANLIETQLT